MNKKGPGRRRSRREQTKERGQFFAPIGNVKQELTMKPTLLFAAGMIALMGTSGANAAGDVAAGKAKAAACAGCHGANGQGVGSNPALAGMTESEFVQAMADYKSGKRANPVMKALATPLSAQDNANLAAYYSSLPKK
jgi:cytochrome c553